MSDETVAVLKEIAVLLRRRVEQTDEAARLSAEHMAAFQGGKPGEKPAFLRRMEENAERMREGSERYTRSIETMEQARAEERAFHERLFSTLDRQNTVLEALLGKLSG